MFQTLSFCFRIGGPPPLIEEILRFGFIDLGRVMAKSAVNMERKGGKVGGTILPL